MLVGVHGSFQNLIWVVEQILQGNQIKWTVSEWEWSNTSNTSLILRLRLQLVDVHGTEITWNIEHEKRGSIIFTHEIFVLFRKLDKAHTICFVLLIFLLGLHVCYAKGSILLGSDHQRTVGLLYNGSDKTVRNRIIVLTYFKLDTKGVRSGLPIRGSRDCKHLIRRTLVITSTAYNVDIGYVCTCLVCIYMYLLQRSLIHAPYRRLTASRVKKSPKAISSSERMPCKVNSYQIENMNRTVPSHCRHWLILSKL